MIKIRLTEKLTIVSNEKLVIHIQEKICNERGNIVEAPFRQDYYLFYYLTIFTESQEWIIKKVFSKAFIMQLLRAYEYRDSKNIEEIDMTTQVKSEPLIEIDYSIL